MDVILVHHVRNISYTFYTEIKEVSVLRQEKNKTLRPKTCADMKSVLRDEWVNNT